MLRATFTRCHHDNGQNRSQQIVHTPMRSCVRSRQVAFKTQALYHVSSVGQKPGASRKRIRMKNACHQVQGCLIYPDMHAAHARVSGGLLYLNMHACTRPDWPERLSQCSLNKVNIDIPPLTCQLDAFPCIVFAS